MQEKEYRENKINRVIDTAMKNLSTLVDVNTVIGKPMKTEDGSLIIPVSKVTLGFMTGGGEYGEVKVMKKDRAIPFAGGSGAIRMEARSSARVRRYEKRSTIQSAPYCTSLHSYLYNSICCRYIISLLIMMI